MSSITLPRTSSPPQWTRRLIFIEYEVCERIVNPPLVTVRFPCGWGGTGSSEAEALADGIRTVRFFKKDKWVDALAESFEGENEVITP